MFQYYSAACVVTLLVLLAGCDTASPTPPAPTTPVNLQIAGTVTNVSTGAAVSGATVWLLVINEDTSPRFLVSAITDSDGRYTLEEQFDEGCALWNNDVTAPPILTVFANGYLSGSHVSAPVACEETQTIDFTLTPQ